MLIVFYISGHGFGHASRAVELVRALLTRCPDGRVVVRTAAPQHLFAAISDLYASMIDIQAVEADTGIVQIDSLRLDEADTVRRAARFHATFDRRVASEVEVLRRERADLVIGDVSHLPPRSTPACRRWQSAISRGTGFTASIRPSTGSRPA